MIHRHPDYKRLNQPQQKKNQPNNKTKTTDALNTWIEQKCSATVTLSSSKDTNSSHIQNSFFSISNHSFSSFQPPSHKLPVIPTLFVSQHTDKSFCLLRFCFHKPFHSYPHKHLYLKIHFFLLLSFHLKELSSIPHLSQKAFAIPTQLKNLFFPHISLLHGFTSIFSLYWIPNMFYTRQVKVFERCCKC